MVYGYIRVSTQEQNLENQRKAISEKYKVQKWIEEKRVEQLTIIKEI